MELTTRIKEADAPSLGGLHRCNFIVKFLELAVARSDRSSFVATLFKDLNATSSQRVSFQEGITFLLSSEINCIPNTNKCEH